MENIAAHHTTNTAQHMTKRPLTIQDLQYINVLSAVSASADEQYLVFVTTKTIIEENAQKDFISVVKLDTNEVLASCVGSSPKWSPVRSEVAYMADYNGSNYLWVYKVEDGEHKPLVPVYESHYFMGHLTLQNFEWSPDGSQIAYVSAHPVADKEEENVRVGDRLLYKTKGGRCRPLVTGTALTHIWIVSVEDGNTRQITEGIYNEHSICWSPDGDSIAFISNQSIDPDNNQLYDLWSIHLPSNNITRHTDNFGTAYQPSWSPDGTCIAFLAITSKINTNDSPAQDTHLYIVAADGNEARCLTKKLDRRIEQISWHPFQNSLYFTAGDKGTTAIYTVDIVTAEIKKIAGDNCHILEYTINKSGSNIFYISIDTTHLTEIFLYDQQSNTTTPLTTNSKNLLQQCYLQPAETFWFNSFDGLQIQGWLIKPVHFDAAHKYPMVLVIHGGPHNMFGYEFEDRMQLLAANGYAVLFINPRGSSGYGQAFSSGNMRDWGGGDYLDLMAGVDAAIEQNYWIDRERLGVTGQSYGGYMTNWIITQTDRFKAAVVDGGISNLISFAGTSLYHSLMESEFRGSAYDNFSLLWHCSPIRCIKNVTTPTLLLHGETDNEVPLSQAEEMYIGLKKQGVETMFVQYVGEGHGWRPDLTPKNRYDVLERTLAWMNKYLA